MAKPSLPPTGITPPPRAPPAAERFRGRVITERVDELTRNIPRRPPIPIQRRKGIRKLREDFGLVDAPFQLEPNIQIVAPIPEDLIPAQGTVYEPADPGNLSVTQLFNPTDSGIVARCTGIVLQCNVAETCEFTAWNTALSTEDTNKAYLIRVRGNIPTPICQTRRQNPAARIGTLFARWQISIIDHSQFIALDPPITLYPGRGFIVGSSNVNRTITMTFHWNEETLSAY